MELLASVNHLVGQLPGQCLQHRNLAYAVALLAGKPAAVIQKLARGVGLRFEHRQALADHLLVEQHTAESLALFDVLDGELERGQRIAHRHRRRRDAFTLEILHHRIKSGVLFSQKILCRHSAVFEYQLSRVRTHPAGFIERAPHAKTRGAFLDNKHGNAARALGIRVGTRRDEIQIRVNAVGDEHLGAVQHPVSAITPRAGAHAGHIRAGIRFGHRHRCDALATNDPGQIFFQLCLRSGIHQMR